MKSPDRLFRCPPVAGAVWVFLMASSTAWAQGRVLPVDEMTRKADVIGVATIDRAVPHNEPRTGFINTDLHLTFSEVWKGEASPAFILIKPGGEVDGKRAAIAGQEYEIRLGEKILVFATPSDLGNHVVIGLRQGLYRVGGGGNPPLFRVSDFPHGPGSTSSLTLDDVRNQVFTVLGNPARPKADPKSPEPESPPAGKTDPAPPTAAASDNIASPHAATAPADPSGRRIGALLFGLVLVILAVVFLRHKKAQSRV